MKSALIVIDVQNEYFAGGKLPLWNTEKVLENNLQLIESAKKQKIPVILVQHISSAAEAPIFTKGSDGM